MAGAFGNQNAVGNRGGGRPTLERERANLRFLEDLWEDGAKLNREELRQKVKDLKKNISGKEVFALKVLAGDNNALKSLIDKLFANKNKVEVSEDKDIEEAMAYFKRGFKQESKIEIKES